MKKTQVCSRVDFEAAGKQHGHLHVPYSYNLAGWASQMVPVTIVANASGP